MEAYCVLHVVRNYSIMCILAFKGLLMCIFFLLKCVFVKTFKSLGMMPYSLVQVYQCVRQTCFLEHEGI